MTNKLLIIEDNPAIAKIQKHIGIKLGFEVDIANSLAAAIDLIEQNEYFCSVVDFVLPDAPYGEAIPFTIGADISTIVMTGKLDNETREYVLRYPIVDYITKESRQAFTYLETQLARLPKNINVRILIVEDSFATRKHLNSLLSRHKYKVSQASDGAQALKQLNSHSDIQVIITDNEMPIMDGITLTSKIRETFNNDEKVIIGISSSKDNQVSARFLKNGANDYLRKPFFPEEFYCRLSQNIEMLDNIATIKQQANSDYLTKLPNRRYFFEQAEINSKINEENKQICILAMIDIDHFKAVNDNLGHDIGDEVLKGFAKIFMRYFNDQLIARLGGEEFSVYFTNTSFDKAKEQLETFRKVIEKCKINNVFFTVSIGLIYQDNYNIDQALKAADEHLYTAKKFGRNILISDKY
ncbi:response regulator [Pseudoalteromonas denitrificans]|uniref:diguanylate cyclase n=1 Tax=Pseudoalteromonas denitrificans DSM 6059 TaxID=1123010 RepID=A0A1I1JBS8_9GAMM|nr:response regulator [Pseudoalteromonas denitrificans]SFC43403.1 response regulator receiver modulated diguanylate cyclase [Pseudoalteromonas denitrificans DSM 6059]